MQESAWTRPILTVILFFLSAGSCALVVGAKDGFDFALSVIAFAGFSVCLAYAVLRRAE